jgi:hypothetical protein
MTEQNFLRKEEKLESKNLGCLACRTPPNRKIAAGVVLQSNWNTIVYTKYNDPIRLETSIDRSIDQWFSI